MVGSVSHNNAQDRCTYSCCGEIVVRQGIDNAYRKAALDYTTSHVSHTVAVRLEIKVRDCPELATEAEGGEPAVDGSGSHPNPKCEEQKYEGGGSHCRLHSSASITG